MLRYKHLKLDQKKVEKAKKNIFSQNRNRGNG